MFLLQTSRSKRLIDILYMSSKVRGPTKGRGSLEQEVGLALASLGKCHGKLKTVLYEEIRYKAFHGPFVEKKICKRFAKSCSITQTS